MFRTALVVASVLFLAACSEKSATPGAPAPASKAKLDIENPKSLYKVESAAPAQVRVGETGQLLLAVRPNEGAKVKAETPFKVKLSSTAPVELSKAELAYADSARVENHGPVFEVPFQAKAAGAGAIQADMTFFVCTDEACVRTTDQVQVPVTVAE